MPCRAGACRERLAHATEVETSTYLHCNGIRVTLAITTALAPGSEPGVMDLRKIPDWLLIHPELRKRGIILHKPLQPVSTPAPKYSPR